MAGPTHDNVLLVRAGPHVCALLLPHVVETMRALPVTPLSGVPAWVRGASVIRGRATPVVLLSALLGTDAPAEPSRLVSVRAGDRTVALAVDSVIGVAAAPPAEAAPLLSGAAAGTVGALGAIDGELVAVLDAARVVPAETWTAIAAAEEQA